MSHVTDFGNVKLGDKVFVDIVEKDIFGKAISKEIQLCKITQLCSCSAYYVWVTFEQENGHSFAQKKKITTKIMVHD